MRSIAALSLARDRRPRREASLAPSSTRVLGERRIVALDGVRGLMTILVVLSHYFAEIPGGLPLGFGWIAVDVFFVLSGFLVGKLILDKGHHPNFYDVFYARRICRTFPIYFLCVALVIGLAACFGARTDIAVPVWSYFIFLQNMFMSARDATGSEWIAPTWTLAVEEQFYLVVPALMLATPRRYLFRVLAAIWVGSVVARFVLATNGYAVASLALLPTRADGLTAGLLAAWALRTLPVDWTAVAWRAGPLMALFAVALLGGTMGDSSPCFVAGSHAIVSIGAALFLLSLVSGSPEAVRFGGRMLGFFGRTSYATYLTHLPILWAAHAVVLRSAPGLADSRAWTVTLMCLPITVAAAWTLTRVVEEPITAFGRGFAWGERRLVDRRVRPVPGV